MIADTTASPPLAPWQAIGLSAVLLVVALVDISVVIRTRNRAHARVGWTGYQTPWWRVRIAGFNYAPIAAGAVMMICWAIAMFCFALFAWTDVDLFGVVTVITGLGGTLYFLAESALALFTDKYDQI